MSRTTTPSSRIPTARSSVPLSLPYHCHEPFGAHDGHDAREACVAVSAATRGEHLYPEAFSASQVAKILLVEAFRLRMPSSPPRALEDISMLFNLEDLGPEISRAARAWLARRAVGAISGLCTQAAGLVERPLLRRSRANTCSRLRLTAAAAASSRGLNANHE